MVRGVPLINLATNLNPSRPYGLPTLMGGAPGGTSQGPPAPEKIVTPVKKVVKK